MLFKALVLGHVLLASAYENKALHELQADVDTLEKTLESLFDDGATLHLTDPSVPAPVKLIVKFKADDSAMVP